MNAFARHVAILANSVKFFSNGHSSPFSVYSPHEPIQQNRREIAMKYLIAVVSLALVSPAFAAEPADVAAQRSRLRLASVPQQTASVLGTLQKLKSQRTAPGQNATIPVVLTGQIGGMPNPWNETHPDFPFFAGQASFFLVDDKIAAQFAHHAAHHGGGHNCTFCQNLAAKKANTVAVVNFVDEDGKILKIDARKLLGVEENQRVTIRGRAELLAGTMLVIHADGVHLRR
jgi:hypothetical protein